MNSRGNFIHFERIARNENASHILLEMEESEINAATQIRSHVWRHLYRSSKMRPQVQVGGPTC